MTIVFQIDRTDAIPIDVRDILPETLRGKNLDEIRKLPILRGNQQVTCGECFEISETQQDCDIVWRGQLTAVGGLCQAMKSGTVYIDGDVGNLVGATMQGGEIEIRGSAGDYLGCEMTGGLIRVRGNVGNQVGGALAGSARGMRGGEILVHGNAGRETGCRMRRGLIVVAGSVGEFAGYGMLAGTILVFGDCDKYIGSDMVRGTIGCLGNADRETLLSAFRRGNHVDSVIFELLGQRLRTLGFEPHLTMSESLRIYHGDCLNGCRGEVLLHDH